MFFLSCFTFTSYRLIVAVFLKSVAVAVARSSYFWHGYTATRCHFSAHSAALENVVWNTFAEDISP